MGTTCVPGSVTLKPSSLCGRQGPLVLSELMFYEGGDREIRGLGVPCGVKQRAAWQGLSGGESRWARAGPRDERVGRTLCMSKEPQVGLRGQRGGEQTSGQAGNEHP